MLALTCWKSGFGHGRGYDWGYCSAGAGYDGGGSSSLLHEADSHEWLSWSLAEDDMGRS